MRSARVVGWEIVGRLTRNPWNAGGRELHTHVPRAGHKLDTAVGFPAAILQIITKVFLRLSFIALGDVTSHNASSIRSTDCTYQDVGAFDQFGEGPASHSTKDAGT
jgi:hypothetical protein